MVSRISEIRCLAGDVYITEKGAKRPMRKFNGVPKENFGYS